MINNPPTLASPVFDTCIHSERELTANVPVVILKANTARKYALLMNTSPVEILLVFSALDKVSNKGILIKPGGSYEINFNNLYVGAVCAVSKLASKISFTECVE